MEIFQWPARLPVMGEKGGDQEAYIYVETWSQFGNLTVWWSFFLLRLLPSYALFYSLAFFSFFFLLPPQQLLFSRLSYFFKLYQFQLQDEMTI
jgi:hypothetical protein